MNMSQSAFDDWFSIKIRRNRKSFIQATITLYIVVVLIFAVVGFFNPNSRSFLILYILFGIPFVICNYTLASQRLRDMNATGWLALLWIPAIIADKFLGGAASLAFWIVLCTVPGTYGANRYGPDPISRDAT